jgi:pimeloyl-ACP methyl ester carboxylesterase
LDDKPAAANKVLYSFICYTRRLILELLNTKTSFPSQVVNTTGIQQHGVFFAHQLGGLTPNLVLSLFPLFAHAAGPPRKPTDPAVIIITGLGQHSRYWAGVLREISSFARVYSYDRSGYGKSKASPNPGRVASVLGLEAQQLLQAANVKGPYIVIAHSYGGIISREFLTLEKENIVGMVFIDAVSEFSCKVRPKGLQDALGDLQENVDWNKLYRP